VTEVYRAGIDSVHPSQRQAALAVGLTGGQALRFVVLPQAVRRVLPPLLNDFVALQKDVGLISVLGAVDAIVVDLPTAFYLTAVELDGGEIIGQLPETSAGGDQFGLVLAKGSPLTERVTAAVDALREDGTLDDLAAEWLGGDDAAPVLE
jgi:polar amino acid transport system substrate-binding protein